VKLQISNATKSFGGQQVLDKAFLQVKGNEKIALVGRNGCGKTTLLKIIAGQEDLDSGERIVPNATQIGYLNQITFLDENISVLEELEKVFEPLRQLEKQMEEQVQLLETDHSQKQLERYDAMMMRFELMGGYDYEHELRSVFFHMGFSEEELHKQISEFSSGQKTRIALVKLLLEKPDVLLLDEPTNHLDVQSIEWLENYVRHYPSAVILVSHDRMFLDRIADEVVEIEFGKTMRFPGNYSHYVQAKKDYLEKNHEAYVRQQQEIERLEGLIEKFRYKKNKAAFAQSKIKYLDRMEKISDSKSDTSRIKATFVCARKGGKRVLEVEDLSFGYDKPLSQVSFELIKGDHLAIVGPNGTGKSTLIKTLMEILTPLGGSFHFGHQIDTGYFDQDSAQLYSNKNVLDELWDDYPDSTQTEIRNTLAAFLFTQEEVFKDVVNLSGGERVRLALAKLMMAHDNLLVLDEPTNHLDIPAREALEDALMEYDGTILFVSHDRMFLKKMASRILEIGETSKVYNLNYEEYTEKKNAGTLNQIEIKSNKKEAIPTSQPKGKSFADTKALKNRVAKLESLLEKAEQELEELRELRYEPEYYQDYRKMEELDNTIDEKHNEINALMSEWEEKSSLLEENQ
jgi:ATP-binding cassette subfamily F protein 3